MGRGRMGPPDRLFGRPEDDERGVVKRTSIAHIEGFAVPGEPAMADDAAYVPPKVWTWNRDAEHRFAAINRPIAGPTHDAELPVGRHPFQLYSLATPNGVKVTV